MCSKDKLSANSKVTWLMLQAHASGITKITASVCTELAFEMIALKTLRTRFVSIQSQLPSSKHLDNKSAKRQILCFPLAIELGQADNYLQKFVMISQSAVIKSSFSADCRFPNPINSTFAYICLLLAIDWCS